MVPSCVALSAPLPCTLKMVRLPRFRRVREEKSVKLQRENEVLKQKRDRVKSANKTRQRKLPLFIHVSPAQPVTLNKTCRYCPNCDLLIAHQDEIEDILSRIFTTLEPEIVGNDYLVIGTVEQATWKRTMQNQFPIKV